MIPKGGIPPPADAPLPAAPVGERSVASAEAEIETRPDAQRGPEPVAGAAARWLLPAALVGAVFACFWPALGNDFVSYDDDFMLTGNFSYRGLGAKNLRWMFTTFLMGHYQPLSWVTFGIDHALWGMDPRGYHLTNVILHAVNTVLFYRLAVTLLSLARARVASPRATAALAALLFGIHPLRVESVAWATERRDVLSGAFLLLTVLAWLRTQTAPGTAPAPRRRRALWYGVSLACFALSLLSKAWGVTLPVVLLVLDAWPLGRLTAGGEGRPRAGRLLPLLVEKIPFALLAGADAIVTSFAVARSGAMAERAAYTLLQRAAQAAYGLCFYVRKTIVPLHLSPLYLADPDLDPRAPAYVLSALSVAGAGLLLWVRRRRWPAGVVAFACYAILVSPVLGFAQSGPQIAADRYTYLACMPFAVLAAAGFGRAALAPAARPAVAVIALAIVAVLGTLTWRQTLVWRDTATLWSHALALDPGHWMALAKRGFLHHQAGRRERALADYDAALSANPRHARTYTNRGSLRLSLGDRDGAIADWSRALALDARIFEARVNRGAALLAGGRAREAVADLEAAVRLEPGSAVAWFQLARAYERAGDEERALAACRRAAASAPAGSRLALSAREMEARLGARRGGSRGPLPGNPWLAARFGAPPADVLPWNGSGWSKVSARRWTIRHRQSDRRPKASRIHGAACPTCGTTTSTKASSAGCSPAHRNAGDSIGIGRPFA